MIKYFKKNILNCLLLEYLYSFFRNFPGNCADCTEMEASVQCEQYVMWYILALPESAYPTIESR